MGKYLDPERTLSLGLLAVPDAVYEAAPEAHGEGYRLGVLVVPYSLALPYVLALYRLTVRFGCAVDTDQLADRIRGLEETLRRVDDEVEGRLSRGLVQAGNARDASGLERRDDTGAFSGVLSLLAVSTAAETLLGSNISRQVSQQRPTLMTACKEHFTPEVVRTGTIR